MGESFGVAAGSCFFNGKGDLFTLSSINEEAKMEYFSTNMDAKQRFRSTNKEVLPPPWTLESPGINMNALQKSGHQTPSLADLAHDEY